MRQASTTRHRRSIRTACLAGVATMLCGSTIFAQPATAQQPLNEHSVKIDILSVTPSTPAQTDEPKPLTVVLSLTNTTDQSLDSVTVRGERGNPISTQQALDEAIKKPEPADQSLVGSFDAKAPVTTALGPRASVVITYSTTSEIPLDEGLCICHNAIYPLYFTAHSTAADGSDTTIGSGQTYVPAFKDRPQPVQVSWVWPIVDHPHRLFGESVFIDDELAYSVDGGRLDRILNVVEQVGRLVPMTLVIDPELIDELAVMSEGAYQVEANGISKPGTGSAAASSWLQRLRAVLLVNPQLEVHLTPFADPDVESLTRNGLSWTNSLSQRAQDRVSAALGRSPPSDLVWPADEVLSQDTLNAVVRQGAKSVILSDAALPGGSRDSPAPNQLASVQTVAGPVVAAVTSKQIQRYVAPVLSVGGPGLARLPELVAEIAIRAAADGSTSHFVVIVPPRTIDPNPEVATRAILDTAHNRLWSTGMGLDVAISGAVTPADHGQLVPPGQGAVSLSPTTIAAAQNLSRVVPALTTMLSSADANTLLGSLPAAVQRAESSAWRSAAAAGNAFAERLSRSIDSIESGVEIVRPSTGTYTLASSNSPLPITIHNKLSVTVTVRIHVASDNGLPGFTAADIGRQTIPAGQNLTLHIPTHVERPGRFLVQAVLTTPSGVDLGPPVTLSVHSTALGAIGVIITVVAGAVLALALLVRFARRWHGRPRDTAPVEPVDDTVAVP